MSEGLFVCLSIFNHFFKHCLNWQNLAKLCIIDNWLKLAIEEVDNWLKLT